jgi:hypothetical protein
MTLTLTLSGETLGEVIDQMRFLLDTVKTDEGAALLAAMNGPLPKAVRRASPEHTVTLAAVEAAQNAEAPPVEPDDLRTAMRLYVEKFGEPMAQKFFPSLLGAARVSDVPREKLWRAKSAIEAAISSGNPAGRNPRRS